MTKKQKKGFTLIELLVVIAIIGLLATLSVVALNNARARARDSRRVSDIKQIQTALELHFNEHDAYPIETEVKAIHEVLNKSGKGGLHDFINPIPQAPEPADGGCDKDVIANGNNDGNIYGYESDATGSTYSLHYCLGNDTGGILEGDNTAGPTTIQ